MAFSKLDSGGIPIGFTECFARAVGCGVWCGVWGLCGECGICVGSLGCVEWHVRGLGCGSGVWGGVGVAGEVRGRKGGGLGGGQGGI